MTVPPHLVHHARFVGKCGIYLAANSYGLRGKVFVLPEPSPFLPAAYRVGRPVKLERAAKGVGRLI